MSKPGTLSERLHDLWTSRRAAKSEHKPDQRTAKQRLGDHCEDLAEQMLNRAGLKSLVRNYYCRFGEIDLIALDGRGAEPYLVFIEVRYRRQADFGGALASITKTKQHKLKQSAHYYCQLNKVSDHACRFDVVCVGGPRFSKIDWIENAF